MQTFIIFYNYFKLIDLYGLITLDFIYTVILAG